MYLLHKLKSKLKRKLYDLPKIGYRLREYELNRNLKALSPGKIGIDCGANVGKITSCMARSGAKIYAFEPDPKAFEILVKKFGDSEQVVCFNQAVSNHRGTAKLYFHKYYDDNPTKFSTGSSLFSDKGNVDGENFILSEIIDLAEFIDSLIEPVGLIKIDVEGEEVAILNKFIDLNLHKKIGKIIVETHERIPSLKTPTEKLRRRIYDDKISNIDLNWA